MARVLITGGAGFIGSHLVRYCLAHGDEVHAIVRQTTRLDRIASLLSNITLHDPDCSDRTAYQKTIADIQPEVVFHLAAHTRREENSSLDDVVDSVFSDLGFLALLLSACSQLPVPLKMFVRTGSLAEYGRAKPPFVETQLGQPMNTYGASMLAGTQYLQMLQPRLLFPAVTARLALTYGPGQSEAFLIPSMIRKCNEGTVIDIKHPNDTRDLIYIDDVVEALIKLSNSPNTSGHVLNIASGKVHSMKDTANIIAAAMNANPELIQFGRSQNTSGMPDFRTSVEKAEDLIHWRAHTPLKHGLKKTITWMLQNA